MSGETEMDAATDIDVQGMIIETYLDVNVDVDAMYSSWRASPCKNHEIRPVP